jgi:hypothetical protein
LAQKRKKIVFGGEKWCHFKEKCTIFTFFFLSQVWMTKFGGKISAVGVRHPAFQIQTALLIKQG